MMTNNSCRMKKLFILITLTMSAVTGFSQTVSSALSDLDVFVSSVQVNEQTTKAEIDSLNAQFKTLKEAYKAVKSEATDDDVQAYFRITTRYKKAVAPYYSQRTSETLDDTADKVSKWFRRQYKKAKGTVEGMKEPAKTDK